MPEPPPILDSRTLKEILQRLKDEASLSISAWTPPPDGDAGTMLQLAYARLLEIFLERLNQVSEKNLLAFLDKMGVSLLSPSPAKAPLTFALKPGTAPTFIPQGMQSGTQPSASQPDVLFETNDDLTVIPTQITQAFTIDPVWDLYTDQTVLLSGKNRSDFTPFVGTKRIPHILYIGDEALLNFRYPVTIEFISTVSEDSPWSSEDLLQFWYRLIYQHLSNGALQEILPEDDRSLQFKLSNQIDSEMLQGVGLRNGIQCPWLRVVLPYSLTQDTIAQTLRLTNFSLRVSASNIQPDIAFNNTTQLDITKEFRPFGANPKIGDVFYLSSQDAFSKPGAVLRLSVEISSPPALLHEYWNGETWLEFPSNVILDNTNRFTEDGIITLAIQPDTQPTTLADETAYWFRVSIADNDYQYMYQSSYAFAPLIEEFQLGTTLSAPISLGQTTVSLTTPEFLSVLTSFDAWEPPVAWRPLDRESIFLGAIVLKIGTEYVQIVNLIAPNVFEVVPAFLESHDTDTFIERLFTWRFRNYPNNLIFVFATLHQPAQSRQNKLVISSSSSQRSWEVGDVLGITPDGDNELFIFREFITIKAIQSITEGIVEITGVQPLRFDHSESSVLVLLFPYSEDLRCIPSVKRESPETELRTRSIQLPSYVFSEIPEAGDHFYFGIQRPIPPKFQIRVKVKPIVQIAWDFLDLNGWQSIITTSQGAGSLLHSGEIVFSLPHNKASTLTPVNSQKNYWIRARIVNGNYGLPLEFVFVDPEEPNQGFRAKSGTGTLNPPLIKSLKISYEAVGVPTLVTQNGFLYKNITSDQLDEAIWKPFVPVDALPQPYTDPSSGFYVGLERVFPEQPVSVYVPVMSHTFIGRITKSRRAIPLRSSALPSLLWEYFNGTAWIELTVIDGTNHFTESGLVKFLTPTDIKPLAKFDLTERYWIRARSSANHPFDTQRLQGVFLNTVTATQAVAIANEILGSSSGRANQTFRLTRTPVLPEQQVMVREPEIPPDREYLSITQEEGTTAIQQSINPTTGETEIWVRWHEVPNFIQSDSYSRHYTLDHTTGMIQFGDSKRGIIPPVGTNNIIATYQVGGGVTGNVLPGAIAQIKTPKPGVTSVTNPIAAEGGAPPETVPMVIQRGPQTLRHRDRAVTSSDLEWLARQAVGTLIARSKCLPNLNRNLQYEPGWMTLLIVPNGNGGKLVPGSEIIRQVEDYLSDRTFVGLTQQTPVRINVAAPGYIQVAVKADIVPRDIDNAQQVKQRVLSSLDAFFHPLTGGSVGRGWEFGRDVYISELYQQLEGIPGVSHVKRLQVFPNLVQNRLDLASPFTANTKLPIGSRVMTENRHKMALLAESVPVGIPINRIAVKGFQEGDRITRAFDVVVQLVSENRIAIEAVPSDHTFQFPQGSVVLSLDGTRRTYLKTPISAGRGITQIEVEDAEFAKPNDVLTLLYPFPMTVMSATMIVIENVSVVSLAIEPYEADITFRRQSVFATLDNQIRLPLFESTSTNQTLTTLKLQNFEVDDRLTVTHSNYSTSSNWQEVELAAVHSVEDVVYLDDNFLVYSGNHRITMVNDTNVDKEVQ